MDVLKNEKENNALADGASSAAAGAAGITTDNAETKKVAELERTVFILKRVVEKLQTENKRLSNGKQRPCIERTVGKSLVQISIKSIDKFSKIKLFWE